MADFLRLQLWLCLKYRIKIDTIIKIFCMSSCHSNWSRDYAHIFLLIQCLIRLDFCHSLVSGGGAGAHFLNSGWQSSLHVVFKANNQENYMDMEIWKTNLVLWVGGG